MTKSASVTQIRIKRALKAVQSAGVDRVIKITKDGELLILDPKHVINSIPVNDVTGNNQLDGEDDFDLI